MEQVTENQLNLEKIFKHAKVSKLTGATVLVVEATNQYIPIEEFKAIFNYIGELVKDKKIDKLIFDKRKLSVFHQPSMEWYFVEWKEKMFDLGLTTHRKILPNDTVFVQSVKIGRESIYQKYPHRKFNQMDIQYAATLEEAIAT